jgi:hypothetical protein
MKAKLYAFLFIVGLFNDVSININYRILIEESVKMAAVCGCI